MMRKERDLDKAQVVYTSGDKSFELQVAEDRHKEWYAENQELLDRDSARLRAATADTHKLTEQVEKLKMGVGKRANQSKTKERAGDAKRIKDLERQVKEMVKTIRQRNPNSLPALSAANAPAVEEDGGAKSSPPTQTRTLLERHIQRLEVELESHDDEVKCSLRAMEQQYEQIKLQDEQQISDLEQQFTQKHPVQTWSPGVWQAQVCSLQQELELLKENHQSRGRILQAEVHSLQEHVQELSAKTHSVQDLSAKTHSVQELSAKTHSVQELSRTVERLQRERKTMLCGPGPRSEGCVGPGEARRQAARSKGPMVVATPGERGGTVGETATFPPTQDEKDYQPTAFSGSHISGVLQESEGLRLRLELFLGTRSEAAISVGALSAVQQHSAEQVSSLRANHQRELENLLTGHALAHSSSKVAELTNQVTTQEVKHLRDHVKELQGTKDALAVSKLREDTLQNQVLVIPITFIVPSHIHNFINTLVLEVSLQGNICSYYGSPLDSAKAAATLPGVQQN
uniref:Centrosomal protein of 162 kDa n=1 Tax=Oncorhynchus tshawytscha TaxID=74940 RepID=A0AAZ3SKM7_ONCTS